jgi:protein gp37
MGCGGCELFPNPTTVILMIRAALLEHGVRMDVRAVLAALIAKHYAKIKKSLPGHVNEVTATNIWHFRALLRKEIAKMHGQEAGKAALKAIKTALKCYAAKLHFNRGANILKPNRKLNKGYAQCFEQVTDFPGRMAAAANWKDTLGQDYPDKPWMNGLPSTNFISDMGDSLCSKSHEDFEFLKREIIANVSSEKGLRHLWLWLSKRPAIMAAFANHVGGMPVNLCAMTTVTGPKTLGRVDQLRKVKAACRGLSIEPLWDRIPPEDLDLTGIDWVIVGGESGARDVVNPFHAEWALELREHCRKAGVSFFVKQLGSRPFMNGEPLVLTDRHGGNWDEWPRQLRVREFPAHFHQYRAAERPSRKRNNAALGTT